MSTFRRYEAPTSSLSRAQKLQIYKIFWDLDQYHNVRAREITNIFGTPDGHKHILDGLNHAKYLKTDPVQFKDTGDVGGAQHVFFEVAKVICKSESPENWKFHRQQYPRDQRFHSFDYDPSEFSDIAEFCMWTHNGIKYEVWSDIGENWFFRGSPAA